jgi:predicted TIM-barrel fold metal-dependent hydrolase
MSTTPSRPGVRVDPVQEFTFESDTRDILANATRDIDRYGLRDRLIVDVDAHHEESLEWGEVLDNIDREVLREYGKGMAAEYPAGRGFALNAYAPGLKFQEAGGRIPHGAQRLEVASEGTGHSRTVIERAVEAMGLDYQVVFPQTMLGIGTHPHKAVATALIMAYNKWFANSVLGRDPRIKSMLNLPIEDPDAALETIRLYHDHPDVIGFLITSQRYFAVHHNALMPVYAELERVGAPLGFHAGPNWGDSWTLIASRRCTPCRSSPATWLT